MEKLFRRAARVALVSILLVVIAGSVVRMTGSGMGCPDWPKCFGYLIPPTDESEVLWEADHFFEKGQMIVKDDALYVATEDFTSTDTFDPGHWEVYEKHDYAIFNVAHTWTEYINRLVGAFSGLPVLLLVVLSLFYFRKDPLLPVLSFLVLFLLLFEAWLGKVVVDSNLAEYKISLHMGGALLIVAFLLLLLRRLNAGGEKVVVNQSYRWLLLAGVVVGLIQIGLGTQVRESIDVLSHSGLERSSWVSELGQEFFTHRTFAWLVVILTTVLVWLNYKRKYALGWVNVMAVFILLEIIGGIVLVYGGMPAFAQPMHLFFAFLMFAFSFFALLKTFDISRIARD